MPWLADLDDTVHLLLGFGSEFGQLNGKDAVLDLGADVLLVHLIGQDVGLLVVGIGELAAHIVARLALFA